MSLNFSYLHVHFSLLVALYSSQLFSSVISTEHIVCFMYLLALILTNLVLNKVSSLLIKCLIKFLHQRHLAAFICFASNHENCQCLPLVVHLYRRHHPNYRNRAKTKANTRFYICSQLYIYAKLAIQRLFPLHKNSKYSK